MNVSPRLSIISSEPKKPLTCDWKQNSTVCKKPAQALQDKQTGFKSTGRPVVCSKFAFRLAIFIN